LENPDTPLLIFQAYGECLDYTVLGSFASQ